MRVAVAARDSQSARRLGFALEGNPTLVLHGDWKSRQPGVPGLFAVISFVLPAQLEPLDPQLNKLNGRPATNDRSLIRYDGVRIPIRAGSSQTVFSLVSAQGKVTPITVRIDVTSREPLIFTAPSCGELGVEAEAEPREGSAEPRGLPGVAFVHCLRKGSSTAVRAWTWKEFRLALETESERKRWLNSPTQNGVVGVLPLYPQNGLTTEIRFALSRTGQPAPIAGLTLTHTEARSPSWVFSASLGTTWTSYTESTPHIPTINVSQFGLTAKVQTQFNVLPPHWDLAFSVFGTVLPLTNTPSSLPAARWFGLNARAGYRIALDRRGRNTLSILPGYYAWSMFVSGSQYGVQNLNGPQLVLSYNHETGSPLGGFATLQRFGGFVKGAVMDAGFAIGSPANHEVAGGLQITTRFFAIPKPLVFSIDVSSLRLTSGAFTMDLSTFSFSLGASLF